MNQTGRIVKKPFATGTKSEREGIFLVGKEQEYLLRLQGGNTFFDEELEKLVGQNVFCQGTVVGEYTFLASTLKILP